MFGDVVPSVCHVTYSVSRDVLLSARHIAANLYNGETKILTGQGKLEKVGEFVWSGKVKERSEKILFLKSQRK